LTEKSKPVTLVVRRGALRRFDRLKQATRELPAEVIWDRRAEARGADPGANGVEPKENRRKATPSTWDLADFVVTENGSRTKSPAPKKA
jgi:thioredoxin reductase